LTSHLPGQPKEEERDGVRIYRVFSWRKGVHDCGLRGAYSFLASAYPRLLRLARSGGFQVIHYFFTLPTAALALLPGRHRSLPMVVSLRGSDVPYYDVHNRTIHRMNLALRPLIRLIWRRADAVVALSRALRETAHRTAPQQPIEVIPNGVEADLFTPLEQARARERDDPVHAITVSRLVPRKGIQYLLRALQRARDTVNLRLTIVGTGSCESELKALSATLRLDDVVRFHGYCPREKLPELYRSADFFALPSLAESFGLVFAEAMSCGLPVIAGRTGGVPDLIGEDNGILVSPGSVEEIASALVALGTDPIRCRAMSVANRTKVVQDCSWAGVAERYADLYCDISPRG